MVPDTGRSGIILDSHPLWLDALEPFLLASGIDVVARATSPEQALALLAEHKPDLFITELRLNGRMDGAAYVREATRRFPTLIVIVLSGYDDPVSIEEALSAGAAAFVSKSALPDDLASAVRQVFSHSVYLANQPQPRVRRPSRQSDRLPGLTRREAEILDLVAEGYSNGRVAKLLWVTDQTVKFHLSNIYRKLGVTNRTEATHWALTEGLGSDDRTSRPLPARPGRRRTMAETPGSVTLADEDSPPNLVASPTENLPK
jgi:DNA-binding NarL/FixJ family response regulator